MKVQDGLSADAEGSGRRAILIRLRLGRQSSHTSTNPISAPATAITARPSISGAPAFTTASHVALNQPCEAAVACACASTIAASASACVRDCPSKALPMRCASQYKGAKVRGLMTNVAAAATATWPRSQIAKATAKSSCASGSSSPKKRPMATPRAMLPRSICHRRSSWKWWASGPSQRDRTSCSRVGNQRFIGNFRPSARGGPFSFPIVRRLRQARRGGDLREVR